MNELIECNMTPMEQFCVVSYTATAYHYINNFLIGSDSIKNTYSIFTNDIFAKYMYSFITNTNIYNDIHTNNLKKITNIINTHINSNNLDWFRNILYKYFVLLYSSISRCPKQSSQFIVFRGSSTHYLKMYSDKYYYTNSFTSTSTDIDIATSFSKKHKYNNSGVTYKFIVNNDVPCIYIGDIEDEVLILPFQLYRYINKDNGVYYYSIVSSNIHIPNNYNEFMEFKQLLINKTEPYIGGNRNIKKITIKNINIPKKKNKIYKTKKNHISENIPILSPRERFKERMNMPITYISNGIKGTPDMDRQHEECLKFLQASLLKTSLLKK